jgi:hypothetical protein
VAARCIHQAQARCRLDAAHAAGVPQAMARAAMASRDDAGAVKHSS